MMNKLALIGAASAALVGVSHDANALPTASFGWHLSNEILKPQGTCASGGLATQVGYYGEIAPRVGHTQDAALVIVARNAGCGPITVIPTFVWSASDIARDPSQAVMCEWVSTDGNVHSLPTTSTSGCSNSPLPNPYNFSNVYGWATLSPGETLRVYLPVTWLRPVSPTTFTAQVETQIDEIDPTIQFNIEAGPQFSGFTTTNNATSTTVQFTVTHHPDDLGDVVIEYGTSTNYSSATPVQSTSSAPSQQMTFVLPNLNAGTQYHYRVRYIVPSLGVTWTGDRTFGTAPATIALPAPTFPCWRKFGC
jgi:hypothetical protein